MPVPSPPPPRYLPVHDIWSSQSRGSATQYSRSAEHEHQRGFPPRCFQFFLCILVISPQLAGRDGLSASSSAPTPARLRGGCPASPAPAAALAVASAVVVDGQWQTGKHSVLYPQAQDIYRQRWRRDLPGGTRRTRCRCQKTNTLGGCRSWAQVSK